MLIIKMVILIIDEISIDTLSFTGFSNSGSGTYTCSPNNMLSTGPSITLTAQSEYVAIKLLCICTCKIANKDMIVPLKFL